MPFARASYPVALVALLLGGCGGMPTDNSTADHSAPRTGATTATAFAWPPSLVPFGDGYPAAGNSCRRVGESAATSDYLDDSAILVGCPGRPADPAATAILSATKGRVVAEVDGVTLISLPTADANSGLTAGATPDR